MRSEEISANERQGSMEADQSEALKLAQRGFLGHGMWGCIVIFQEDGKF